MKRLLFCFAVVVLSGLSFTVQAAGSLLANVPANYPIVLGGNAEAIQQSKALAPLLQGELSDAHRDMMKQQKSFCAAIALDGNWILFGLSADLLSELRAESQKTNPPEVVRNVNGRTIYVYGKGNKEFALMELNKQLFLGSPTALSSWQAPVKMTDAAFLAKESGYSDKIDSGKALFYLVIDGKALPKPEAGSAGANPLEDINSATMMIWEQAAALAGDIQVACPGEDAAAQLIGQMRMMLSMLVPMALGNDPKLGETIMSAVNFSTQGKVARVRAVLSAKDIEKLVAYGKKQTAKEVPAP